MLAMRLADEAARARRKRGGIRCPWEVAEPERGGTDAPRKNIQKDDETGLEPARDSVKTDDTFVKAGDSTGRVVLPRNMHTAVTFPHDRPVRTGRRRETGFPAPVTLETISHTVDQLIAQERTVAGQGYFHTPQVLLDLPQETKRPTGSWGFEDVLVKRFPALAKRNFVCVQEHQATGEFDCRGSVAQRER